MILGMGVPELLVILVVALVIFGPKNLPKLGTALGQTVRNVREGMEEEDEQDEGPREVSAASSRTAAKATTARVTCPNCHAEVPADSEFCSHCGARLDEPSA